MTITNGYTTLALIKARLWPAGSTPDTVEDTTLENIITAVSREIDAVTGRRYWVNSNDETRYYRPQSHITCLTDDIVSITTLKTDDDGDGTFETTWTTSDYQLMPYNATLDGLSYNFINIKPLGSYNFAPRYRSVEIVGKFGFTTAPMQIQEACIIQSMRLFRRKDAPFGVTGGAEMGQAVTISKFDPDVELLLRSFMRIV